MPDIGNYGVHSEPAGRYEADKDVRPWSGKSEGCIGDREIARIGRVPSSYARSCDVERIVAWHVVAMAGFFTE